MKPKSSLTTLLVLFMATGYYRILENVGDGGLEAASTLDAELWSRMRGKNPYLKRISLSFDP